MEDPLLQLHAQYRELFADLGYEDYSPRDIWSYCDIRMREKQFRVEGRALDSVSFRYYHSPWPEEGSWGKDPSKGFYLFDEPSSMRADRIVLKGPECFWVFDKLLPRPILPANPDLAMKVKSLQH